MMRKKMDIVVVGDKGSGKSSLIETVVTGKFPRKVNCVLDTRILDEEFSHYSIKTNIIDTSYEEEEEEKRLSHSLAAKLQLADVVVLTYACDNLLNLERISDFWMPELERLKVTQPVIVVGCKHDKRSKRVIRRLRRFSTITDGNDQIVASFLLLMDKFHQIDACLECSRQNLADFSKVFFFAQRAIFDPLDPLYDLQTCFMSNRLGRALRMIFYTCDPDEAGFVRVERLESLFQDPCFEAPITSYVQDQLPQGVHPNATGLNFMGFMFFNGVLLEKGVRESIWKLLRKFGYNNDVLIADQFIPSSLKHIPPNQTVELTSQAKDFLEEKFNKIVRDREGRILTAKDVDSLFRAARIRHHKCSRR